MAVYLLKRDINVTKEMLYARERDFSNFYFIKSEDVKRILKFARRKIKDFKEDKHIGYKTKLALYVQTIEGLTEQSIYRRLKNFDEKMFFLINMVDPKLEALNAIQGDEENLEAAMLNAVGFYDERLLKFEDVYRREFIDEPKLTEEETTMKR